MQTGIKYKIQKQNYRKIRQLTSSKLSGKNTIRMINFLAVSLVRYTATTLKWAKNELKVMEERHEKL